MREDLGCSRENPFIPELKRLLYADTIGVCESDGFLFYHPDYAVYLYVLDATIKDGIPEQVALKVKYAYGCAMWRLDLTDLSNITRELIPQGVKDTLSLPQLKNEIMALLHKTTKREMPLWDRERQEDGSDDRGQQPKLDAAVTVDKRISCLQYSIKSKYSRAIDMDCIFFDRGTFNVLGVYEFKSLAARERYWQITKDLAARLRAKSGLIEYSDLKTADLTRPNTIGKSPIDPATLIHGVKTGEFPPRHAPVIMEDSDVVCSITVPTEV